MNIQVSKSDVIWSYLGYFFKVFGNIILLPIIIRKLTADELGVWFVFLSIGALIQLLDLGFTPTIMRNISYAYGGATNLKKEGIDTQQRINDKPNYELIFRLIYVSKKLYLYVALLAFVLLLSAGTYYLSYITGYLENNEILIAWFIYIVGIFCNFYYSYWIPILSGIGKIKQSQQATIISQLFYVVIGFFGILVSYGLIALALAFLVSGIVLRLVSKYYLNINIIGYKVNINNIEYKKLFNIIWPSASKMGIVSLGAFLILQANTLICSTFFDLKTTAEYGLTLQLISVISAFSGVVFRSYLPTINEARIKKNKKVLKEYLSFVTIIGWLSFVIGALILILFGKNVLIFIGSKTELLPQEMLVFMIIYLFLEFNHSNFASFIVTNNEVPFVKASIFSGISIVLLSLLLIKFMPLSLWSILISQALIQVLYNNWRWPLLGMRQLEMNLLELIYLGINEVYNRIFENRS